MTQVTEFKESICEWCGVNLTVWHDAHEINCPWELLDFLRLHVCSGDDIHHKICFPCLEFQRYIKHDANWNDPKYHTEFCREFRVFLDNRAARAKSELPKIRKRPESET